MSSGIIPFLEGRESAIKAWKMDGHIPLEEVKEEFGINAYSDASRTPCKQVFM